MQRSVRKLGRPLATRLWDIDISGYERLPDDGPAILCPNHISFLDSAFLMLTVPRNISFVGKAEYMDSWKTKYLFPAMGMIPIDRSGGERSTAALDAAEAVLRRGELFGIFPEGTRSRNGTLHKGRTGAARLGDEDRVSDLSRRRHRDRQDPATRRKVPKLFRSCQIKIGRPITPERYANRGAEHIAWRSMIDEVMYEIRELTGQEYVNRYAGEKAETEPTVAARVASVTECCRSRCSTAPAAPSVRTDDRPASRRSRRDDRGRPTSELRAGAPSGSSALPSYPGRTMSTITISLPDGSERAPRARHGARPGRIDRLRSEEGGRCRHRRRQGDRSDHAARRRCRGVDHHERHRGRPPRAAPLDVARAGPGRDAAVPRRQVLHRPGDRERLLLRLRPAGGRRSATTTWGGSRRACARSSRPTSRSPVPRCR